MLQLNTQQSSKNEDEDEIPRSPFASPNSVAAWIEDANHHMKLASPSGHHKNQTDEAQSRQQLLENLYRTESSTPQAIPRTPYQPFSPLLESRSIEEMLTEPSRKQRPTTPVTGSSPHRPHSLEEQALAPMWKQAPRMDPYELHLQCIRQDIKLKRYSIENFSKQSTFNQVLNLAMSIKNRNLTLPRSQQSKQTKVNQLTPQILKPLLSLPDLALDRFFLTYQVLILQNITPYPGDFIRFINEAQPHNLQGHFPADKFTKLQRCFQQLRNSINPRFTTRLALDLVDKDFASSPATLSCLNALLQRYEQALERLQNLQNETFADTAKLDLAKKRTLFLKNLCKAYASEVQKKHQDAAKQVTTYIEISREFIELKDQLKAYLIELRHEEATLSTAYEENLILRKTTNLKTLRKDIAELEDLIATGCDDVRQEIGEIILSRDNSKIKAAAINQQLNRIRLPLRRICKSSKLQTRYRNSIPKLLIRIINGLRNLCRSNASSLLPDQDLCSRSVIRSQQPLSTMGHLETRTIQLSR